MAVKAVFRTRLADLMKDKQMSRMDLVREAKISYPTIARYETEDLTNVDADKIFALMQALDCSFDELITFTVEDGIVDQAVS